MPVPDLDITNVFSPGEDRSTAKLNENFALVEAWVAALQDLGILMPEASVVPINAFTLALVGDADGAKWLVRLGSFSLTFYSDNTDTSAISGVSNITYNGRTYRAKLRIGPDGSITSSSGGKSIISTTESRTSAAYVLMPTPDRVQNVVLPTDGLIEVGYQATWKESVQGAARAAIFIGVNQLKVASPGYNAPVTQAAAISAAGGGPDVDSILASWQPGLVSGVAGSLDYSGDVTTGQALGLADNTAGTPVARQELAGGVVAATANAGGVCLIRAAAGTYDVSIQFKSASGSVTVKNRRLWVRVRPN